MPLFPFHPLLESTVSRTMLSRLKTPGQREVWVNEQWSRFWTKIFLGQNLRMGIFVWWKTGFKIQVYIPNNKSLGRICFTVWLYGKRHPNDPYSAGDNFWWPWEPQPSSGELWLNIGVEDFKTQHQAIRTGDFWLSNLMFRWVIIPCYSHFLPKTWHSSFKTPWFRPIDQQAELIHWSMGWQQQRAKWPPKIRPFPGWWKPWSTSSATLVALTRRQVTGVVIYGYYLISWLYSYIYIMDIYFLLLLLYINR